MYRYNPLQHPLEIRVIRFGTALAVSDPHLQVTISHVRLDKRPVYKALSYTWGDTTLKEIVECDNGGGQLLITANCALALRRLRLEDELTPIWIDSICINQNDIPERNQQILLISDVYRLVSKVQVYLGEEDEDSALGMAYFRDPRKFLAQQEEGRGFLDVSAIAEQPKQAVNRILSRAWFGRVWVFQEVLVSSAVDVLCGSDKVTWSQLTTSIWAWGGRNRIFLKEGIKEPPILFRFAEKRNRSSALEILLRYMHEARSSKSTDPRDKIYAVLGIAADTAAGFLPFRPDMNFEGKESYKLRVTSPTDGGDISFLPDYNKSITEVFVDFTISWIQQKGNLDAICGGQVNSSLNNLPTWVPDWSICSSRIALLTIMTPGLPFEPHCKYSACMGQLSDAVISDDRRALQVAGHLVGFIHKHGDAYYDGENTFPEPLLQQWRKLAVELEPYTTGQSTDTALFQTIFAAQLKDGNDYNVTNELMARWLAAVRLPTNVNVHMFLEKFEQPDEMYADLVEIRDTIKRVCNGRRFATTTTGYMGLVPAETELGDIVSVLLGGQVPFILRKRHDHYILVGEAYIHGIMNGESMGNPDLQSFTIR